jgi:hypothetical protein
MWKEGVEPPVFEEIEPKHLQCNIPSVYSPETKRSFPFFTPVEELEKWLPLPWYKVFTA